ncbi:hypothetical protein [Paenibacillus eucommiae]|uniref:Uncharacterized protein n=1 Tax=Paenibacillus eucommiae TaxID=1355755 RepID=A0ABS4IMP0_9BACL|nr:hypothetical protein [Paenibacillus eucommiae]MBP1988833.1 hypothetical protein [Paenibacillus eucommiae]
MPARSTTPAMARGVLPCSGRFLAKLRQQYGAFDRGIQGAPLLN